MKRVTVLAATFAAALRAPAAAQQAGKTYRVGILGPSTGGPTMSAFPRALAGLSYHEGKNLELITRFSAGDITRLPVLAAELVRANPDVIVAEGYLQIAALKRATSSIPVVMAGTADPVASGFVASLAHPGGNITGIENLNEVVIGKQLQLLGEIVPHLRRVAVLRNPSSPANTIMWREAGRVGRAIGIQTVAVESVTADQLDAAFKAFPHIHADAIIELDQPATLSNPGRLVRLVAAQHLPAIYQNSAFTAAGGLMYYGASESALWSEVAIYVDRILKGAKPADLPVERPTTFDLAVNLKTALVLGLTVPQSILLQATQVIR